jgi:hypothetical protein
MKQLFVIALLVLNVGCAAQSTYSNTTDSSGNQTVQATGRAAEEAAKSSTSHNCINCTYEQQKQMEYMRIMESRRASNQYQRPSVVERVVDRATTSAGYQVERKVGYEIDKFLYEVFN